MSANTPTIDGANWPAPKTESLTWPVEVTLTNAKDESVKVRLWIGDNTIFIGLGSHGHKTLDGEKEAHQVAVDVFWHNGDPDDPYQDAAVFVWDDINEEEPKRIGLAGARLTERQGE